MSLFNSIKSFFININTSRINKKEFDIQKENKIQENISIINQLPNVEKQILKKIFFNERKRFNNLIVMDLIDNGYLEVQTHLTSSYEVIVELKPLIRETMKRYKFN